MYLQVRCFGIRSLSQGFGTKCAAIALCIQHMTLDMLNIIQKY